MGAGLNIRTQFYTMTGKAGGYVSYQERQPVRKLSGMAAYVYVSSRIAGMLLVIAA